MALAHPCERVSLMFSAQTAKTAGLLNVGGQIACETPATVLWVLPSLDEASAFNREKLDPMIQNSPAVRQRIKPLASRDNSGSTMLRKIFPGGNIEIVGANSSKGLQMRTKRVVIMDEISEFPFSIGTRGDPVLMAETRTIAWGNLKKIIAASTPGLKGTCRITKRWEEGSAGRYHVPCPHCHTRQALKFANLHWPDGKPELAAYHCDSCGAAIQHAAKRSMLAAGAWVHEHPERLGSHASYALNTLYSPFATWSEMARKREESRDDPQADKVFTQQWLGEAYEAHHDLPSHEVLHRRRDARPQGRIPPGVLFLEGATDVQGNRLEWGVYGFDRHFGQWLVDGGVLEGDPNLRLVWDQMAEIMARDWPDAWGRRWRATSWGIDSGFLSPQVYRFTRRHAGQAEPRVMALDGRAKWGLPAIGTPTIRDVDYDGRKIGVVQLWPVGTWDIKSEVASAMRLTEMGPDETGAWRRGAMRFHEACSANFFQQLCAEACVEIDTRQGTSRREWKKLGPNEQWDLATYTRALARHDTAQFTEVEWDGLSAKRLGPAMAAQPDLASFWAPGIRDVAAPPAAPPPAPEPPLDIVARPGWAEGRAAGWGRATGWGRGAGR